ncbi:MAG: baseplate assembly protein [Novosphingobium sp.]|nr:baseplate assembly protein [Novosphingobium sp.]
MPAMPATSSTAVDLSRLPAPTIVEQLSFEAIKASMIADLQARDSVYDALVESDPAFKQIEVFAYRELMLRQTFNDRARQLLVAYATGSNLDHLGAIFGVARLVLVEASEGVDQVLELDDAFRGRIILAPESYSCAGPEDAYVYHARRASGDVLDASATSPTPGAVVISVLSTAGSGAASGGLIADVAAIVAARNIRVLTDNVTVQSAAIVNYTIEAEFTLFDGPDSEVVLAAAAQALAAYQVVSRKLGRDHNRAGINAALCVAGVQNLNLIHPAADVTVTDLQAAYCTGTTLTVAGIGD